jgi:hypothetical protein
MTPSFIDRGVIFTNGDPGIIAAAFFFTSPV